MSTKLVTFKLLSFGFIYIHICGINHDHEDSYICVRTWWHVTHPIMHANPAATDKIPSKCSSATHIVLQHGSGSAHGYAPVDFPFPDHALGESIVDHGRKRLKEKFLRRDTSPKEEDASPNWHETVQRKDGD